TVTTAHSKTRDLPEVCRRADLLFAAVGRPEMVRGHWIKPGATVIDVGINRLPSADGKSHIVGDVAFEEARSTAGALTPVPGGAGGCGRNGPRFRGRTMPRPPGCSCRSARGRAAPPETACGQSRDLEIPVADKAHKPRHRNKGCVRDCARNWCSPRPCRRIPE